VSEARGLEVVERDFGDMALNMGPQHPSTHGVLRLVLTLRGETVVKAVPVIGYLHRGVEKLSETLGWDQLAPIYERNDYIAPTANSLAYCVAVEKLGKFEVPRRAAWLRTLVAEINRYASHLVWLGTWGLDLGGALGGGTTLYMYAFRERERIMDFLEELTGTRFHTNYNLVGGVRYDLDADMARKARALVDGLEPALEELWAMTGKAAVFQGRVRGVGVIPRDLALSVGTTGPTLRGSGVAYDVRKDAPYDAYPELEFDVPVRQEGDCYARFEVRMEEMRQSLRLCREILDGLPEGPLFARKPIKNPKAARIPAGEAYAAIESPRGEMGFYLVSDGKALPYRLKINAPSFCNMQAIPHIMPGHLIADVVAILGSLDPVAGDVDR
jgi:NADH-quinone oxidoreductase subunit D